MGGISQIFATFRSYIQRHICRGKNMHILPDVSLTLVYGIVLIFVAIQAVASDILDSSLVVA